MRLLWTLGLSMTLVACKTTSQPNSGLKDLAYDGQSARNVAAFFTAPRPVVNTPVYIENDPETIIEGLTALDQNFKSYKHESATAAIVTNWLKSFAGPDYLSEDGTLFLYIAGHGSPDGSAQMTDGSFVGFNQIAQAIRAGRGDKPVKRLVIMVFGCFSGAWINRVRSTDLSKVAEQIFVITSSTSQQYSYSGGYNSQLANAFRTALNSYQQNLGDVTLGQFARDIQRYVPQSTPQYWASPQSLLNETLFNQEAIRRSKVALEKGIMPTPEEFAAGRRSPSRATFDANVEVEPDPEKMCSYAVVANPQGSEFCSAWNKHDSKVFTYVRPRPASSANRCDPLLLYQSLNADSYRTLYEHCGGFLKPKGG